MGHDVSKLCMQIKDVLKGVFLALGDLRVGMINEVIIGENHWGSNPGAYLITNFLPYVSLPFPTPTLHHFTQKNRNVAQSTLSENFYFQHN